MRLYPALTRRISVLSLLLAGAFSVAFGATPPRRVAHRSRAVSRASHSYADPAKGDVTDFDDPIVRAVAVEALGHEKGSVVAVDPSSGRILAIVNQQMAFSSGFEPCSTIKPFVALAALHEGVITSDTMIRVKRGRYMNLTEAMAHSNNEFFQQVGTQLGFDQEIRYEKLLGLGDRVGYNIPEEQPGALPKAPPVFGGVARMSSFGSGIRITPFQLASLASTLANGGTQYYLQYPRTAEERENFESRVRNQLDIAPLLPDLREGMLAAVMYGTAKRSFDPEGEQDLGKTGTCNDENMGGRLGWFVSYADQAHPKIVIVVLLHGGSRVISGPHASQIAGRIYHTLYERNYFVDSHSSPTSGASSMATQSASSRESASLSTGASR
jgi:cell division protein FtsI/penicillin-binding protein 2